MTNPAALPTYSLTSYVPRALCRFDTLYSGGWHIKTYGISARHKRPPETLFKQLGTLVPAILKDMPKDFDVYNIAFAILHEAADGDFILFHWWTGENMLASRVFHAPDRNSPFEDIKATRIIACIWELEIIKFERDLWVETMLNAARQPAPDTYLTRHYGASHV